MRPFLRIFANNLTLLLAFVFFDGCDFPVSADISGQRAFCFQLLHVAGFGNLADFALGFVPGFNGGVFALVEFVFLEPTN